MNLLLVDDHALVRAGLRLVVERIDASLQVLEAADGQTALRLARDHHPELCLMDVSMPGLNGIDALGRLLQTSPHTKVLVVSMHGARHYVTEALRAGARGYLLKEAAMDELADALKALREGRQYLSRRLADEMLTDYLREQGVADSPRNGAYGANSDANGQANGLANGQTYAHAYAHALTPRQREVLQRVAEGESTRVIADKLSLSVKTVETHRAEIMRRLDIWDVAGLTRYAVRMGMVQP